MLRDGFSGIISPYGASDAYKNTPALKHFFRCLDTDGVPRDSIGGVSITSWQTLVNATSPVQVATPGVLTQTYNASLKALENNVNPWPNLDQINAVNVSGNWHTFDGTNKSMLAVYAAKIRNPYTARITIGNASTVGHAGIAMPIGSNYLLPYTYQSLHIITGVNGSGAETGPSGAYVNVFGGGTGYPNGTINAVFTPGTTGSGAAGYFTVVGGVITKYTPTSYGTGYPQSSVDPVALGTVAPAIGTAGTPATLSVYTLLQPTGGLLETDLGKDVVVAIAFTPGSTLSSLFLNCGDSSSAISNVTVTSGATSLGTYTPEPVIKISGLSLYGLALFEFSSLPSNWQIGSKWMGNKWMNGIRDTYPAWVGLT